jgi:hypothetical protein
VLSLVHELPVLSSAWEIHALSFAAFGLPLLGAMGLQAWFDEPRKAKQLVPVIIAASVILLVMWMAFTTYGNFIRTPGMKAYARDQVWMTVYLCLGTAVLFARQLFASRPNVNRAAIVGFLVVDLLFASAGMRPTIERRGVYPDTGLTHLLATSEVPVRVAASPTGAAGNTYPNFGIEQLYGYDGIFPARIKRYINELAVDGSAWSRAEPLLSVTPYLYPQGDFDGDSERFVLDIQVDGVEVRRNTSAFPRARLVGPIERFTSVDDVINRIREEGFDGQNVVLLELSPNAKWPDTASENLGTAAVVNRTPNSVRIDVNATEACTLVLSDAYYPGWRATIDGESTRVVPAYAFARAVPVQAGQHVVEFTYKPASFTLGFGLSIAGMLIGMSIAVILLWRARRP